MNKVLNTIVQSCEELGTLQQDGNVFLNTDDISKCREVNKELSDTQVEEEYRRRTFTTKREEYISSLLKEFRDMRTTVSNLQNNYKELIDRLESKSVKQNEYNREKKKYRAEMKRLTSEIESKVEQISDEITKKYYDVEKVQYKDLVNRLFKLNTLDTSKKELEMNLNTTEEQMKILLDKRRKVQNKYVMILTVFSSISIVFLGMFIYYLFSKNTL